MEEVRTFGLTNLEEVLGAILPLRFDLLSKEVWIETQTLLIPALQFPRIFRVFHRVVHEERGLFLGEFGFERGANITEKCSLSWRSELCSLGGSRVQLGWRWLLHNNRVLHVDGLIHAKLDRLG